jgi:hypothetical protein
VSRIVTGKIQLTLEALSLAAPLAAAVETFRPATDQKRSNHVLHDIVHDELLADAERLSVQNSGMGVEAEFCRTCSIVSDRRTRRLRRSTAGWAWACQS